MQDVGRQLTGTVTFRAQGGLCERFLNLLTRGDTAIPLWDIVYEENAVTAVMRAADYRLVRPVARRTGTRVRAINKSGLPFCARPLMKRPGLWVGTAVALVLYTLLASRMWVIEVNTDDPSADAAVKACLAENGVAIGKRMNDVDLAAVQLHAIAQIENLHRLSLYFDGSIAHVDVQWEQEGSTVPDTTPANIVAAHDGRIVSMQVTSGQAMVKTGEAVVKGDLLVCGAIETTAGVLLRHSTARILAETEHTFEETIPLREQITREGVVVEQSALRLLAFELPLYTQATFDASWASETCERSLSFLGVTLPVGITSTVYTKQETVWVERTREEVEHLARERLTARATQALGSATVRDVVYDGVWEGDSYRLRATYACTEDIAQTVELFVRE